MVSYLLVVVQPCAASGAMNYLWATNLSEGIIMNIQLIDKSRDFPYGDKRPSYCLQSRQMQRERYFNSDNAVVFFHKNSDRGKNYREVKLPQKVSAFFLCRCGGHKVLPLEWRDRLYIIDDKDGFPPGLAECAIELRKKNIWVVQSRFRATRLVNAERSAMDNRVLCRGCGEICHRIKEHDNLAKNILPNTRDELKQTFQNNVSSSPLCALMENHPEQIQRYVSEGGFYCRYPRSQQLQQLDEVTTEQTESVICVFCQHRTDFDICQIRKLTDLQHNSPEGWEAAEEYLNTTLHDYNCRFKQFLNDDALVQVSDQTGKIMPTHAYFIADPALESTGNDHDSGKSCTYTRVFVMADISEHEKHQLIISHGQINELIHQQHLETVCSRTHESNGTLTTALQNFEQTLKTLPRKYQQLYDNSELNRAVASYRNKLRQLPSPKTRSEQEIFDFLADADTPLRTLYVASMQLTLLLPLTRDAGAGVLTILTPKISELVLQYQQSMHAVHEPIDITNLATLIPYELWSNRTLREIGEAGNEILACLNRLNIDDNELYRAFIAHQPGNG